jgi:hypothetical protein
MCKRQTSSSGMARDLLVNPKAWGEVAKFNQLKNPDPNVIAPDRRMRIPLRLLKFQPAGRACWSVLRRATCVVGGAAATVGACRQPKARRLETGANSSAMVELGDGSRVKHAAHLAGRRRQQARATLMRDAGCQYGSTTWFSGPDASDPGRRGNCWHCAGLKARPAAVQVETPTSLVGVSAAPSFVWPMKTRPRAMPAPKCWPAWYVLTILPSNRGAELARGEPVR